MSVKKKTEISVIDVVAFWTVGSLLFFTVGFMFCGSNSKYLSYLSWVFVVWMLLSAVVAACYMWGELEKDWKR